MKQSERFSTTLQNEPLASHLSADAREMMFHHWSLVLSWNERTNLTAILDDAQAASHHYADSLAALPHLSAGPVLDIGSGGGFPGIPLAVAMPDITFHLLEPRRKRVSFLQASVARMGLKNVHVIHGRIQDTPPEVFSAAVTRATFSSEEDLALCLAWLKPGGPFLAYRADTSPPLPRAERLSYTAGATDKALDLLRA